MHGLQVDPQETERKLLIERQCSEAPYKCLVMDMQRQRSGRLTDSAPAPSIDFLAPCTRYRTLCSINQSRINACKRVVSAHPLLGSIGRGPRGGDSSASIHVPPMRKKRRSRMDAACLGGRRRRRRRLRERQGWWPGTDRFPCDPGNPSARSDKMWCAESDFEPRIRKIASYVTPHAMPSGRTVIASYGATVVAVTSSSQCPTYVTNRVINRNSRSNDRA